MALTFAKNTTSPDDLVGLDIGRSHITAARLLLDADGCLKTLVLGEIGLPRGVVDEAGEIVDPDQVAAALRALWKRHRFRSRRVVVGVTGSALTVAPMARAQMGLEELASSVTLEIGASLPFPTSEAQIAMRVVDEDHVQGMVRLVVVACRAEAARAIVRACKAAQLQVVDIEPEPWVLPRVVDVGQGGSELMLNIGMHTSTVGLVTAGVLRYAHSLPMGADHFTRALVDCGYEELEAERFKRSHSLIAPERSDPYPTERAALRACTDAYIEALYQVLSSDVSDQQVERLVLSGGGARLSGLMAYLNRELALPVELAEPREGVVVEEAGSFTRTALAYALAMRAFPTWPESDDERPEQAEQGQ